ncbi:hypothetical protein AMS68_006535 [Peltaster fructicola]|uniref:Nitrate reductase n=1 Tax=Peltaster fructicola TaxID=286661 RepID=A0A6H0Y2E1_9PEZI|nr:hypothetical protein AMS68_006535 [Peltaster fructicola]
MSSTPSLTKEESAALRRASAGLLPPTPPESLGDDEQRKVDDDAVLPFALPPVTSAPDQVLEVDKKTPDSWVPRDSRLIRLTGVHPFNVEAPLSALFDEGFLTSPNLFYVRNHGAVPQPDCESLDWEFSIEGMVEHPIKITLRDLINDYKNVTYPVTLVCAGNRRKEQNVVRKTKGFSWGAAGVSTALWTGVAFGDVLRKAKPKRGARYVAMLGGDELPNGKYTTSVKLNWVLDPNRGMMLAHKMNGEPLTPDHGKPLRVIIPGQIGGRSVKWIKRIIVSDVPSDSYYHLYDNRVLPGMVSPEQAADEPEWWKDERYAIYDLSPNSAIAYPAHEEQISLVGSPEHYRVKGYAYSGGGRRITRVEVTLDKGKSWRLANIDYPEDRYREAGDVDLFGGTLDMQWREGCFCWCFWNIDIPISELADAKDIFVRSMDESMCIQPRDMYWSVLGMMNNPWFRVTIAKEGDFLRMEHPTQPALQPGGWMERTKKLGGDLTNGYWGESQSGETQAAPAVEEVKELKMTKDGLNVTLTIDDLRKHDGQEGRDSWFVLNGEVYDGTPFLEGHPGGATSIIAAAGLDSTDEFMAIHSETAKLMMTKYHIGSLDEEGKAALSGEEVQDNQAPTEIFLAPKSWKKAILHSKTVLSADTRIYRFKLEHEEQILGLPTGQHLMMRLRDPVTREALIRSYTPVSEAHHKGFLDILIKVYFETKEKPGGKMSQAIDSLPIGHHIDFKGPIGKFEYLSRGRCTVQGVEKQIKSFIMICGGSGITPIYQVYRAIMQDKEDNTKCVLLDGNRLLEDILCKAELDGLAKDNDHKSKLLYTLTKAPADWTGLVGRIAKPLLEQEAHVKNYDRDSTLILLCGPEALEKSAHQALLEIGWADNEMLFF